MNQRMTCFLGLKNRPWEWMFSGVGIVILGWVLAWLWGGEAPEPPAPDTRVPGNSIVSGGNTTVIASEDGIAILAPGGHVNVSKQDSDSAKAFEALAKDSEAKHQQLTAYLSKNPRDGTLKQELMETIETGFRNHRRELEMAIEAIPRLINLPDAQPRIEEALSEAARGNIEPAEAMFLETEKRRANRWQRADKKAAAEAARHRKDTTLQELAV